MFSMYRVLLSTSLVSVLFACAGNPSDPVSLTEQLALKNFRIGPPVSTVRNYRINGWSSVNARFIIITTGVSNNYLIGFMNNCSETRSATSIVFSNTAGRLTTADKMLVRSAGGFTDTCFINSITQLEKIEKRNESQE